MKPEGFVRSNLEANLNLPAWGLLTASKRAVWVQGIQGLWFKVWGLGFRAQEKRHGLHCPPERAGTIAKKESDARTEAKEEEDTETPNPKP